MINIYVGKPGMGKTYALTCLAYKLLNEGRDIYSNFWMDFENMPLTSNAGRVYFWFNLFDIVPVKAGEIFMDECQIYMNSREWKSMPKYFQYKLQQHRKHGVNIHGAVQNFKRIDGVARELVNSIFELKRIFKFFVMKEFDIDDIDKAKRQNLSLKFFFLNKKIADCYDTMREIADTTMTEAQQKEYNQNIYTALLMYAKQREAFKPRPQPIKKTLKQRFKSFLAFLRGIVRKSSKNRLKRFLRLPS